MQRGVKCYRVFLSTLLLFWIMGRENIISSAIHCHWIHWQRGLHRDDIYTRVRVQSVSVTRCRHSSYLECVCSQIVSVNSTLLSQPAADARLGHVTRLVRQCDYSYICHGPATLHHDEVTAPLGWTAGDTVAANLEILPLHKYSSAWTLELETKVREDFTIYHREGTDLGLLLVESIN